MKSLWKGPQIDGITYSLLCKFLVCRERFRLKVVEGLREQSAEFNYKIEYGSLFHEGLEQFSKELAHRSDVAPGDPNIVNAIRRYRNRLRDQYPGNHRAINKWARLAELQFESYIDQWIGDDLKRQSLLQEETFDHSYQLPSGRTIRLRGKWDSAFLSRKSVWLQENKTKGFIDEQGLQQTLHENLQTMFYLIPLEQRIESGYKLAGVLYNVIRRPLFDFKSPRQKKSETEGEFLDRVGQFIRDKPENHFYRWQVCITPSDLKRFRFEIFDPILEQLCDWWDSIKADPFDPWHQEQTRNPLHFRSPFGVFNPLASGMHGDFYDLVATGSTIGLTRTENLFPELS